MLAIVRQGLKTVRSRRVWKERNLEARYSSFYG
jgi:hypothetical protein